MPRQANAVDFWRGFALVTIFINHIPGIFYERLTHRNFSISDSADLFVFLAGWSLRLLVGNPDRASPAYLVVRLGGRALQIYAAQILIIAIAIGMLAAAAVLLGNPLLLEWHNAAAVFYDPVPTHVGLAILTHHLGYFDILPLYVVLMLMAPAVALIDRYARWLLLPLSLAVYFAALGFRVTLPSWPVQGEWFFNPIAWQVVFMLGFVLARSDGAGGFARRNIAWLRIVSVPIVIAGALVIWNDWWPDPTKVPHPTLFFIQSKSYVTPMRLVQFLALIALFSATYPYIRRAAPGLVEFLSLLGRNSLNVFCVASLLGLGGQIVRFIYRGGIVADTAVLAAGIAMLALTAWLSEWRDRNKAPRAAVNSPA
ncbi:MAG TPA: OpgC domain-containing protein [Alphaproteobacteria bacterium]|jgi:hypothetical protein